MMRAKKNKGTLITGSRNLTIRIDRAHTVIVLNLTRPKKPRRKLRGVST